MLQVTVKTLDSQNHSFSVPDESTVKEFKDQIAPVLNISAEKQRLIFCGKVLKDDKKLSEYDVDGKVIHVVQSMPPQGNTPSSSSTSSSTTTAGNSARGGRDASGFLLGAFSIPQDIVDPAQVQNIVHDVVSGMGEIGRNATVMSRASDDGTVDVHINLGRVPVPGPLQSEAQLRMNRVQTMLLRANHLLDTLEDGTSSNNGNVADSSSQTETDNSNNESENNSMESEPGISSSVNENPLVNAIFDTNIGNAEITSEINFNAPHHLRAVQQIGNEGLMQAAQACQAAITAAAAAIGFSLPGGNIANSTPLDLRTVAPEPMEESTSEAPIADQMETDSEEIIIDAAPPDSVPSSSTATKIEPKKDTVSSSSQNSETRSNEQSGSTAGTEPSTSESDPTASRRRPRASGRPVQPSVQTLANLLDEVIRFNSRLLPHLEKVRDLIRTDAPLSGRPCADAQRLFSRISQMLHFLSHAFHSLSDLHVNFTHAPPRSPRVRIISSASTTLLHGLPMQAQISITTSSGPSASSVSNTTTTTASNSRRDTTPNSNAETQSTTAQPNQATPDPANPSPASRAQNQVFMEVLPTVTIDSIANLFQPQGPLVNVVHIPDDAARPGGMFTQTSESATNTTTPSSTSNATPTATQNGTSTNASRPSQPATSTPNAVPTLSGQASISMPSLRNLIPVPLTSMGSLHTFDSGLPCHSVWALEPSRRRHNAGGSRTPLNQVPNLTPNFPGRQEDQLQQVISNIVMSLLQNGQGGAAPGVALFNSRSGDAPRENTAGQTNRDRVSRPERSTNSPTRSNSRTPSAATPEVGGSMGNMFSNIGIMNKKISEVFPPEIANSDFDMIGSFFWFLAKNLTFEDLIDLGRGNYGSLTRLQSTIQNYLYENVFQTKEPQTCNYNQVLAQIFIDIDDKLNQFIRLIGVSCTNTRSYVDAFETFLHENLPKVFDALLNRNCPVNTCYGRNVATNCRALFDKFLELNGRYSNLDSVVGLDRIFRRQLDTIIDRIDPVYQHPVRILVFSSLFRILFGNNRNASSSSRDFPMPLITSVSSMWSPNEERRTENSPRHIHEISFGDYVRNSSRPLYSRTHDISGQSDSGTPPALAAFARIAEQTSAILRGNNRNSDEAGVNLTEVVIRPENWHTSIPQDWVPIITRDVHRQRRQAPQAPFSNAYLSGMPSKRRKIMNNDTPILLEHSQTTLSDMLLQAISSADVQPVTSLDEIKAEVSEDTVLQTSFTEHVKHTIQERLQCDLDYCSEKFPNSEKYYKNI